jgi:hypothetical protein
VDRLETPGPGTYDTHSGLQIEFERFKRDPLPDMLPTKCTDPSPPSLSSLLLESHSS